MRRGTGSLSLNFLSLIDVLFSTMGIMILLASIFITVSGEGLQQHLKRGHAGNVFWMEPIFVLLDGEEHKVIYGSEESTRTTDDLFTFLQTAAGWNDTNLENDDPVRYAFVFGVREESYELYNRIELTLRTMDEQMSAGGQTGHFPIRFGKFPVIGDSLPNNWSRYVETP